MYLYEQQNLSACPHYREREYGSVNHVVLSQGEKYVKKNIDAEIVYIEKGEIELRDSASYQQQAGEGELCFLPPGLSRSIYAVSETILTIFCLSGPMRVCKLSKKVEGRDEIDLREETHVLPTRKEVKEYLLNLKMHMGNTTICPRFFILKTEELFLLLNAYYSETERRRFFHYEGNRDSQFIYFVLSNYHKVKTVKEFASLAGVSLSSFVKMFRRVFEMAPCQWMKQKRVEQLRDELVYSKKPLKEVSDLCGFASPSHMTGFCRKYLGMTPGEVRNTSL
ncbi:helix-turn-helix domain-containing protein [Parabacteroides sp. PF5-9]|uniref:AraC family transcriptional regulator n=1 Tax=Parabacteroides sp. PF5-9 TaxID=1742404 RepID=UPI002473C721|nr:helix-turn-helix domain-containing protein [Parabacteroides sp. PF5-9]MDH6357553.1 AraC-like DNA-binding protein [Parabacteroides sp. PF5-9]